VFADRDVQAVTFTVYEYIRGLMEKLAAPEHEDKEYRE